jgi:hypothetical protein
MQKRKACFYETLGKKDSRSFFGSIHVDQGKFFLDVLESLFSRLHFLPVCWARRKRQLSTKVAEKRLLNDWLSSANFDRQMKNPFELNKLWVVGLFLLISMPWGLFFQALSLYLTPISGDKRDLVHQVVWEWTWAKKMILGGMFLSLTYKSGSSLQILTGRRIFSFVYTSEQ